MSKIISEIFAGDYCPSAERPGGYEYDSTVHEIIEIEEDLRARLTTEDWQRYSELMSLKNKTVSLTAEYMFTQGFRTGVRLMVEALEANNQ